MKLALFLLLVCVSVMVCQAAPVQDDSASATVTGENGFATSNTLVANQNREAYSSGRAGKGIVIVNSRSYTSDDNTEPATDKEKAEIINAKAETVSDQNDSVN